MKVEEIVVCDKCLGFGTKTERTLVNHHKKEYDEETIYCNRCSGSGRLLKTVTTEHRPFLINGHVGIV